MYIKINKKKKKTFPDRCVHATLCIQILIIDHQHLTAYQNGGRKKNSVNYVAAFY